MADYKIARVPFPIEKVREIHESYEKSKDSPGGFSVRYRMPKEMTAMVNENVGAGNDETYGLGLGKAAPFSMLLQKRQMEGITNAKGHGKAYNLVLSKKQLKAMKGQGLFSSILSAVAPVVVEAAVGAISKKVKGKGEDDTEDMGDDTGGMMRKPLLMGEFTENISDTPTKKLILRLAFNYDKHPMLGDPWTEEEAKKFTKHLTGMKPMDIENNVRRKEFTMIIRQPPQGTNLNEMEIEKQTAPDGKPYTIYYLPRIQEQGLGMDGGCGECDICPNCMGSGFIPFITPLIDSLAHSLTKQPPSPGPLRRMPKMQPKNYQGAPHPQIGM